MVCLVLLIYRAKTNWISVSVQNAHAIMTKFQKLNKNSNITMEGTCCIWSYDELHEESNGVFSFFIYWAENTLKTNWISVSNQDARAIMTEFQKFTKNSNLTIEGTCCIWLNAELHEESNGVFSFFIYRAENNLKTNWISHDGILFRR